MPRKKKQKIEVNNSESLEGLLQETYNEACGNINSAQREMNKLDASAEPEDVDDHTKIAKSKADMLKIKDSAIKIKLEVAKLQNDILKQNGDVEKGVANYSGAAPSKDEMADIRAMILNKKKKTNEE